MTVIDRVIVSVSDPEDSDRECNCTNTNDCYGVKPAPLSPRADNCALETVAIICALRVLIRNRLR